MKKTVSKLLANNFIQGGILLTASNLFISFLNYLFNFLSGRALGPEGYGEIIALFSYLSIFAIPLSVITTTMIQKIASTSHNKVMYAKAIETWTIEKIKRWWILLMCVFLLTPFVSRITNLTPVVSYSLIPLTLFSFFAAVYDGAFQGLRLFALLSFTSIIAVLIKLSGAVLVSYHLGGLGVIVVMLLISGVVKIVLSKLFFLKHAKKYVAKKVHINKRIISTIADPQLWLITISLLSITLLNNIDVIFVKKFFSAYEAGIYSLWSLFAKIILFAIGSFITMGFIFFASKDTKKQHGKVFLLSLIFIVITGIGSYIGYRLFGAWVVTTFFGSGFEKIIPYLGLASIFGTLYITILYVNNFFLAQKSRLALLLPISIPVYLLALFMIPHKLDSIMYLNNIFSGFFIIVCLIAYMWRFFYNVKPDGKKKT